MGKYLVYNGDLYEKVENSVPIIEERKIVIPKMSDFYSQELINKFKEGSSNEIRKEDYE